MFADNQFYPGLIRIDQQYSSMSYIAFSLNETTTNLQQERQGIGADLSWDRVFLLSRSTVVGSGFESLYCHPIEVYEQAASNSVGDPSYSLEHERLDHLTGLDVNTFGINSNFEEEWYSNKFDTEIAYDFLKPKQLDAPFNPAFIKGFHTEPQLQEKYYVAQLEFRDNRIKQLQDTLKSVRQERSRLKAENEILREDRDTFYSLLEKLIQNSNSNSNSNSKIMMNFEFHAPVGNVAGTVQDNASQNTSQYNNLSLGQQSIVNEVSRDVQTLLDSLSAIFPVETEVQKTQLSQVAIQRIEAHPPLKKKVIRALDAGLMGAIGQALNHPVSSFFIEAIKEWNNKENS